MKNNRKSTVAIVKVQQNDIESALDQLLDLLSGMESYALPFQTVLIKPNWVSGQPYQTGAVTHPRLIEACVKQVLRCGVKQVYIGDSSMVGLKTEEAIENSGLKALESRRVKLVDFKKSEYISVGIPNALRYRRLAFPRELMEAQTVINLPVMKTHDYLPATLALKNMKGVLRDVDKRRFHTSGLEEGIIDTNRIALGDLTIMDGIIGMEGNGPLHGTPADLRLLIGSADTLAAEVVALQVMGLEELNPPYLDMAYEAGFGERDMAHIEVTGERIEAVRRRFVRSSQAGQGLAEGKITFQTEKACSTCRFIAEQISQELGRKPPKVSEMVKICCGGGSCTENDGITIGAGKCCEKNKERYHRYIPGCPPRKKDIISAISQFEEGYRL